jgi:hypothetical protein
MLVNPHAHRQRPRSHSHPQRPPIEGQDDQPADVRSQQQLPPLPIAPRDHDLIISNPSALFALASPTIFMPTKLESGASTQSPLPPPPTPRRSKLKRPSSSSGSLSTRLSNWGSAVDLKLLHRRRSTGKQHTRPSSPTTPRQDSVSPLPPLPSPLPPMCSPSYSAPITPQESHAAPATIAKRVTGKAVKSPPPLALRLSTPDRTILEELKRNLSAREEQFVLRNGVKHQPHPANEVPYPRAYGRENIDLYVSCLLITISSSCPPLFASIFFFLSFPFFFIPHSFPR